ncbi:hypothetical protein DH2020_007521 [Rehmannia glutinosa]|uniref:DUF4005 domain-containing protein n=1 Tax=Rehmannia glutinosa TaxID=99300 RepID=A0ABR0TYG8_REHGL
MGRSSASCFKIISCGGGDAVDHDDLETPEIKQRSLSKGSSDRRGWSFRKRSARHRVLSNSVISEAPSSANKENPESPAVNFQVQPDLSVPEKTPVIQWTEEKTELPAQPESKLSDTLAAIEDDCKADAILDEPSIIIIQASIRRLLAQQVLLKQKNIIKLQAVVRGHIVRRHAIGTLRCVQSIIKMQALVRARRARQLGEGSGDSAKLSESIGKDDNDSTLLGKKEAISNGAYTYVSIEKLLSNAFARQLMESTPRTKHINIKCDPLKSDSAWKWLERWMSVSSVSNEGSQESGSTAEQQKENLEHSDAKEDILVPSDCYSESTGFTSGVGASAEVSENHDNLISYDANNFDLHSSKSISPSASFSELHNVDQSNSRSDATESAPIEMKETDFIEVKSLPEKEETENEPDLKKFSSEQPESEAKKLSRKASNPAFIAAQSKFEELSSAPTSAKLTSSSSHDLGVDSGLDKVSSSTDRLLTSTDIGLVDNTIPSVASAVQIGSECGTELSISSTLDSPDRSEAGVNYIEQETKVLDETEHPISGENLEFEASKKSIILETEPSYTNTNDLNESLNPITTADSPQVENKQEADPSDLQLEVGSEISHLANKSSSPEGSPRSHITVPESQATPSSQVSVKPKKSKGEKSESNRKKKSSSADKNRNQDSGSRSSLEQLQELNKNGKRRNSFGSAKPDHKEQEPRDSSSSNTLPSYMQATESARAKAIANGSPRSSPDVHEKDIYVNKLSGYRFGIISVGELLYKALRFSKAHRVISPSFE